MLIDKIKNKLFHLRNHVDLELIQSTVSPRSQSKHNFIFSLDNFFVSFLVENHQSVYSLIGGFEEHEDISCTHLGEKVEWLTCLSHDSGIIGSNFISVDDKLGIIVPQKSENFSEIFIIEYEIVPMPHPKLKELEKLLALKNKLQVS